MTVDTCISYGYIELINIFCKANELDVTIVNTASRITVQYEDKSDTDDTITFMSFKHLGFENMLCDYLIRCGIAPSLIGTGSFTAKRDMKALDKDWEEHRKRIGLR